MSLCGDDTSMRMLTHIKRFDSMCGTQDLDVFESVLSAAIICNLSLLRSRRKRFIGSAYQVSYL